MIEFMSIGKKRPYRYKTHSLIFDDRHAIIYVNTMLLIDGKIEISLKKDFRPIMTKGGYIDIIKEGD